jgi:hypothetical protein
MVYNGILHISAENSIVNHTITAYLGDTECRVFFAPHFCGAKLVVHIVVVLQSCGSQHTLEEAVQSVTIGG